MQQRCFVTRKNSNRSGFTLIELLVVVVIIAILSGVLLPVFLQARDKARKLAEQQTTSNLTPLRSDVDRPAIPAVLPSGSLPILDALILKMTLTSSYHRIGMDIFTRYRVDCTGQVVFLSAADTKNDHVLLLIPFPDNALEVRDVQVHVHRPGSQDSIAPNAMLYTKKGVYCVCDMTPRQRFVAEVSFTALGREQLDYALPPSRQLRSIAITLDLPGGQAYTIPDEALQPSTAGPEQLRWEFKNLVSDRRIVVLIPGAEAPLARVLLLSRLVAFAVLLFGAGFWYLSEQVRSGQLDGFRLGHFLLLALTYSLFFVIFAVLEFHGGLSTPLSMLVSVVFSLPLLILHVSRVLNRRFAITRVVPLAIFTVGLVVIGVYGTTVRDYVFIAAAVGIVGYVTFSYQGWAAGREHYQQEQEAAYTARRRALIEKITTSLGGQIANLAGADARAADYYNSAGDVSTERRVRLEKVRQPVSELMKEYEELTKQAAYVANQARAEAVEVCNNLERKANVFGDRLALALENLESEFTLIRTLLRPLEVQSSEEGEQKIYCSACGCHVPDTPFCQQCGAVRPLRMVCEGCGDLIVIPVHLLALAAEGKSARMLFCPHCGTRLPVLPLPNNGSQNREA